MRIAESIEVEIIGCTVINGHLLDGRLLYIISGDIILP